MITITLNRQAYRSVMLALGMAWTGEPIREEPFPTVTARLAPALCLTPSQRTWSSRPIYHRGYVPCAHGIRYRPYAYRRDVAGRTADGSAEVFYRANPVTGIVAGVTNG